VESEKTRRRELEQQLVELKRDRQLQRQTYERIDSFYQRVETMASQISEQLAPAALKTVKLK